MSEPCFEPPPIATLIADEPIPAPPWFLPQMPLPDLRTFFHKEPADKIAKGRPWHPVAIVPTFPMDIVIHRRVRKPVDPRKRLVRKLLNTYVSMKVDILDTEQPPELVGEPSKLTTKNGTPIRSYRKYRIASGGRNIFYHKSTRRITVGKDWHGFDNINGKTKT